MLHFFSLAQAKKSARALEKSLKRDGILLQHGRALDALAMMSGFSDWNGLSSSFSLEAIDKLLSPYEVSNAQESSDLHYLYSRAVPPLNNGSVVGCSAPRHLA